MACRLCEEFRKEHPLEEIDERLVHVIKREPVMVTSSPIRCAFEDGPIAKRNNWGCQTLLRLRSIAKRLYEEEGLGLYYRNDDSAGSICVLEILDLDASQQGFIVLGFYKDRGSTPVAIVVNDEECEPLLLDTAERVISYYEEVYGIGEKMAIKCWREDCKHNKGLWCGLDCIVIDENGCCEEYEKDNKKKRKKKRENLARLATEKRLVYNPVTKRYYVIRERQSPYKPGSVKGLWKKPKRKGQESLLDKFFG